MNWDSLQSIKNQIDKAKDNKTWHILSAHDQNEITSNPKNKIDGYQYLREILQYIKDTNGAVEVVTWDYMYNTYAEYSGDPIHKGGTATCSERAVCDICNFKYGTISPENHSDINFVKAKDEVHTQTELKGAVAAHHVCEGCKKVFKDNNGVAGEETTITELTSKAPEHNKANIKNAPANCGVNGYIGNKYCSVCDKKMENGADIPATGKHTGGTATCIAQAKCTVCQLQYGSINANNHKYSAITDPDCDDCGAKRELGNQFVKEADGKYHYYNNGVHSKVTDLVKIDGKWLYLEKGVWANTVDTLHKINGKWFLIKKGIWTATTGLTEYKGKTFYVVGGKWNSNVNDLKKINGKWYFIKSGKWDSSLESLHKLNGKWFLVKGGMWTATTGLVKHQGKQFYVVGGKWESRTGVYKISGKNYFIKGGKWDKTITTLYKKSGKLLSIKNGMWTKSKAIIKYSGKKYYCDDGYAQTKKTGKVKVSGKTYTVKKGIVK
jgi:glucan-binding YG repeat protein